MSTNWWARYRLETTTFQGDPSPHGVDDSIFLPLASVLSLFPGKDSPYGPRRDVPRYTSAPGLERGSATCLQMRSDSSVPTRVTTREGSRFTGGAATIG